MPPNNRNDERNPFLALAFLLIGIIILIVGGDKLRKSKKKCKSSNDEEACNQVKNYKSNKQTLVAGGVITFIGFFWSWAMLI